MRVSDKADAAGCNMAIDLKGQTALVTGAAKRLGRHIALALAAQGVNVAAHYHSSAVEAESLLVELKSAGVRAWTLRADFEKPSEYEGLIQRLQLRHPDRPGLRKALRHALREILALGRIAAGDDQSRPQFGDTGFPVRRR